MRDHNYHIENEGLVFARTRPYLMIYTSEHLDQGTIVEIRVEVTIRVFFSSKARKHLSLIRAFS